MRKQIKIENYDREIGGVVESGMREYLGVDIDDKHYILFKDDFMGAPIVRDVTRPRTAYELVSYNKKTDVATAREVTDSALLDRIAVEFHLQGTEE